MNVCTIEDPIEMVEPAFNQMQVHPAIDLGFAPRACGADAAGPGHHHGGRDPRPATAEMAIQAALTGHLVLSTLHTNDAPAAITRCSTWACRPICSTPPCWASWPSAWVCAYLCPPLQEAHPRRRTREAIWDHLVTPWKRRGRLVSTARGLHRVPHDRLHGRSGCTDPADVAELKKTTGGEIDLARIRSRRSARA